MHEELRAARELLKDLTPLRADCGRVCGARCCKPLEGEETGMLLFPGEETEYLDKSGWKLTETDSGLLLICPGVCEREERPLACRLFPLLPVLRDEGIRVAVDQRARAVCPLTRTGIRGMDPAFREAVREAGRMLAEKKEQRDFLEKLTQEQDELKELREKMGGSHV